MSKEEKLLERFLSLPKDFTFNELVTLLSHLGLKETKTGKTSGSRARFKDSDGLVIKVHKPHGKEAVKVCYLREIEDILRKEGKI